jgi:hypothetical protein
MHLFVCLIVCWYFSTRHNHHPMDTTCVTPQLGGRSGSPNWGVMDWSACWSAPCLQQPLNTPAPCAVITTSRPGAGGGMPATVLLKWWFRIYLHQWFSTGLSSGPTCVISRSIGMQRSGIFSGQSWYRSQIFYFVKYILRRWTEMRGHKYSPIPGAPSWGAADWQQEVWFASQKVTGGSPLR